MSKCEFVHRPAHAAVLWIGCLASWIFLEGLECSFSQWSLHNTGPQGSWQTPEAVGTSMPLLTLSFPVPNVLSLCLVPECLGSSLHHGVHSDPVSPGTPKGSARGIVSFTLLSLFSGNFCTLALSLKCAPLQSYLFTVLSYMGLYNKDKLAFN